MNKKIIGITLGFLALVGYISITQAKINHLEAEIVKRELSIDSTTQVTEDLVARIALERMDKDSLRDALEAADALNAELIAASVIHARPDTVYRDRVVVRTDTLDGTRIATVHDTTEAGVLDATITAPPYPKDIHVRYTFAPASIDITVSLLRLTDNTAIFAATYRGGTTEIEAPYARLPMEEAFLTATLAGGYDIVTQSYALLGSIRTKTIFGMYAFVEGQHLFANAVLQPKLEYPSRLFVGIGKTFRLTR